MKSQDTAGKPCARAFSATRLDTLPGPWPELFHPNRLDLNGGYAMLTLNSPLAWITAATFLVLFFLIMSIRRIGPTEVGLVTKRFASRRLSQDNPMAFNEEAGYQADLLIPVLRFNALL